MNSEKLRRYLEISSNIAVLVVSVFLLFSYARIYFAISPEIKLQSGIQRERKLPEIPGLEYSRSDQTLLIALSPGCEFCSESIPFYKRLIKDQNKGGKLIRVIGLFPFSEGDARQYIQQENLNIEIISEVDFKALKIAGTPALVLADKSGKVRDFWIGRLSKDAEHQVMKAVLPTSN